MPINFDDALAQTNPDLDNETKGPDGYTARERSALAIQAGVAANDVYWNHRSELDALKARAEGHGQVVRVTDEEAPATVGATANADAIDSTATDEPAAGLGTGQAPQASPDNPNDAIARLRAQLEGAGITPEA